MRKLLREIVSKFQLSFDRSFSGLVKYQLLWMCLFIFIALLFLFILFFSDCKEQSFSQIISSLFVDMISPVSLRAIAYNESFDVQEYLRLLLVYVVGMVFVSGLLIATLSNAIRTRAESFRNGLTSYSFDNHQLILGFDNSVVYLIGDLLQKYPDSFVVLGVSDQVNNRREFVKGYFSSSDAKRIVMVRCRLNSMSDLEKLSLHRAKAIYLLGEIGDDRDAQNLMAYHTIVDLCKKRGRKEDLSCHVLVQDRHTFSLSRVGNITTLSDGPDYELITMNKEEMWCRKVLVDNSSRKHGIIYPPLDREGIGVESPCNVHLVVCGMTDMGYAMALTAAHIAHYPNFLTAKKRSKITFVDADAHKKMAEFRSKYRALFDLSYVSYHEYSDGKESNRHEFLPSKDFLDIEWEFCQVPDFDDTYWEILAKKQEDNTNEYLSMAICYDSQKLCQNVAFYLPEIFYEKNIPIFYRNTILYAYEKELLTSDKFNNIYPFGMMDESYISDDKLIRRAKKLNYLYETVSCKSVVKDEREEELAWQKLSIVKKWSNIYSVMSLDSYVRSVNGINGIPDSITRPQMEMMAAVEHNRWNIEELLLGYRPTTESEDAEILKDKSKKAEFKRRYVHCDIKPYIELKSISGESIYVYDSIKILNLKQLLS
jgi:hypothetical protein